jgi:hypothetical protein
METDETKIEEVDDEDADEGKEGKKKKDKVKYNEFEELNKNKVWAGSHWCSGQYILFVGAHSCRMHSIRCMFADETGP